MKLLTSDGTQIDDLVQQMFSEIDYLCQSPDHGKENDPVHDLASFQELRVALKVGA